MKSWMISLAISTEYRHVTDVWMDRSIDILRQHSPSICRASHGR